MRRPTAAEIRDAGMFVVGATGFLAEVIRGTDRPNVLFGSLALMAGAAFLRGLRNGRNGT